MLAKLCGKGAATVPFEDTEELLWHPGQCDGLPMKLFDESLTRVRTCARFLLVNRGALHLVSWR